MTQAASIQPRGGGFVESSPIREALKLCGLHMRSALLFSALVNVAYLAPTFYMLTVYDMVVPSSSSSSLVFVTIALALSLMTLTYLDAIRGRILSAASMRLDRVFASRIFRRAMLDAGGGPQPRVNQLIREFDTIRMAVTGSAALAMFDAPWIPIYIAVCFYLHFAIGALALGGSIVLLGLAIWNERSTREYSKRALEASAASYAAQEAAGGSADIVRALGMTDAFVEHFEVTRDLANLPQMEAAHASGRIGGLIRFLRLFLQSVALGLGAWLASLGPDRPDCGALAHHVASHQLLRRYSHPTERAGRGLKNSAARTGPAPASEPSHRADPCKGPDDDERRELCRRGGSDRGRHRRQRRRQDDPDAGPGQCPNAGSRRRSH
jgi:ABC-type protease/lipase transport system fused ATPase/permease subunit